MKKKLLTLMTCIAMTLFVACKGKTSDSEEAKQAQQDSFAWEYYDGLCKYEGLFDSEKTTKQQIQNAYLLAGGTEFDIAKRPAVYKLEDLKRLSKNALNSSKNEYLDKKKRLTNLALPKDKVWDTLRQEKLREMEQTYNLYMIEYKAYLDDDMEALKDFDKNDECLTLYSDALIKGGDTLLSAWESSIKLHAEKFSNPRVLAEYMEQKDSDNKFNHAKIWLLAFAWGNCAVKYIDWFDSSKGRKEFEKLFTSVKEIQCNEP